VTVADRWPLRSLADRLPRSNAQRIAPENSGDPAVRAVVAGLRELPPGPAPDAEFRSQLRAQLVAVTPRLVAEPDDAQPSARRDGARRRRRLGRPFAVVTVAIGVFILLLGGTVYLSRNTLPGQALYGVKRASENVQLSLSGDNDSKGKTYLDQASTRVGEVLKLWTNATAHAVGRGVQADGGVNDHTSTLITDTFADADSDTRSGSRLLTGRAVKGQTQVPLQAIIKWAPSQASELGTIAAAMKTGPLHDRALVSQAVTEQTLARAKALETSLKCGCPSTGEDSLGPLPCSHCPSR
jgi:hypothetical protein